MDTSFLGAMIVPDSRRGGGGLGAYRARMSEVEVVRALYAAMAERDFETLFSLVDDHAVITQDPRLPWGGRFDGHDGLAAFAMALTGTIDSQVEIEALYATDTEVVQYGRTRGTVRATEVPFDVAEMHQWTVRDGKAVAAHFAIDTDAMLAALAAPPLTCPECGFVWATVPVEAVGPRIQSGADAIAAMLRTTDERVVAARPAPEVWSTLEYAAHVRDVLYHVRDRIVIGLAEDSPDFKPLYRDVRVDAGLYRDEQPEVVATELELAAGLFGRTFAALSDDQLARPVVVAFPTDLTRTVSWLGRHVVHEVEHHRDDADRSRGG
jgi:ketosteroid isomerase-like protein